MARKKKNDETNMIGENPDLRDMIQHNHTKYLMINLIASRAGELKRGARSLVDLAPPHSPIELAVAEGANGLLRVVKREQEKKLVNLVETE